MRPLLVVVSARIGWFMVVIVGFLGQAFIVYLSCNLVPGVEATFRGAFGAAIAVALASLLATWVMTTGTDDGFTSTLVRRHKPAEVEDPEVDGVVFVQLDGVPFPVLRWAVQGGSVATIRRWLATGQYELHEWTPQMPCTTPASQLGLLHGTVDGVPAFRWYDRELGRVLVANRPRDAAVIEERASTGRGLLADGGLSLSNLFTGDAPRSMLTMSQVTLSRGSTRARTTVARYMTDPRGLLSGLLRVVGEVTKERFQARRQIRRNLVPRVERSWTFAILRAATNVLQRDLNTAILAEEMARGTRSIYVDYVDYDEVAHHAGITRPESLAALDGLDHVLGTLEQLAARAPRRYHLVIVSDHGQSQGAPFADRYGVELGDLCSDLVAAPVETLGEDIEGWGRASALAQDVAGTGLPGKVAARAAVQASQKVEHAAGSEDVGMSVLGSGNLGLFYVHEPDRLTLEELGVRYPRLVPGLAGHPGIGFVAGITAAGGGRVVGAAGEHDLDTGEVRGVDPLAAFPAHSAEVLARALAMPEAPDLYLNSLVDPTTHDIAAFEPLVGAHGGLGGWQDRAVLLVPSVLAELVPDDIVVGADRLHEVFVSMLERLGHRQHLHAQADLPDDALDR